MMCYENGQKLTQDLNNENSRDAALWLGLVDDDGERLDCG